MSAAEQGPQYYVFPASRAQYQMFFMQKLIGDASTYHVALAYELHGRLDEQALRSALLLLVRRHETLRTHFALSDGALMQMIEPEAELDYLSVGGEDGQDRAWLDQQARSPFDLEHGPLCRARLWRSSDTRATLLLAMHHIVVDGWSAGILLEELVASYRSLAGGGQPELPEPEFQYADYAGWQEEWLGGEEATRQLDFWRTKLGGKLPVLTAGADAADRPPSEARCRAPLPGHAVDVLRALADATNTTLFTVLLTAFTLLLRGRDGGDVVVGTVAANRGRQEFHRTVGPFVNSLAIRTDLGGDPTFRELLGRVRESSLEAFDNQELPFDLVVQAVAPVRTLEYNPVFQALFTLHETTREAPTAGGVRFEPGYLTMDSNKFALELAIADQGAVADADFAYRADFFDGETIERLAAEYRRIVERVAANPDLPISTLAVATLAGAGEPAGQRPVTPVDEWDEPVPYAAPTNATEAALADIFARVLERDRVGIDDNYFEIGGDSIRSVQILARVRAIGLDVRLTDLLLHQTVRQVARLATELDEAAAPRRAERFGLLAPADRALIEADQANKTGIEDAYPLLAVQAGMVFHSEATETEKIYHNVAHYRLRAAYSAEAWERAVAQLLARHEMLRTSFAFGDFSEPVQFVHRTVATPLTTEDLRDLDEAGQRAAADDRLRWERAHPFDLGRPPLMRFHVQRLSEDTALLWVTEHHAIMDGWSARSLFAELLTLYLRELGTPREIPPAPAARFRSVVEAERAALADAGQREFWDEQVRDLTLSPLPGAAGDETAPADMRITEFPLPEGLSAGLLELASSLNAPVRTVLLAAHVRVMALLAGRRDVVTGAVYHGRGQEIDGDRVVGLFLNTLPFRCRLAGGSCSWADLIAQVAAVDLAIQPNRRFPLAEIQRRRGAGPLFETFFNYTHFHVSREEPTGNDLEILDEGGVVPTHFPFGAEFFRHAQTGEIGLALRHDARRLPAQQVERVHGYYRAALAGIVDAPRAPYLDTPLLSPEERRQFAAWNDTARDLPGPRLLPELARQGALNSPDAPAVIFGSTTLTHRELDEAANRMAHRLIELGVRPGAFVGVRMRRSERLVVTLLAVLRAGGAYVPLDPDDPPARLATMAADAGINLLLVDGDAAPVHLTGPAAGVRVEAVAWPPDRALPSEPPPVRVGPDAPAYLIFTSGSTGRPKGVAVSHRAICNRLAWMQDAYPIGASDVLVQKTPFTFDVSLWEFFWPMLAGASLVVARPGGHREPAYLRELIRRHGVSVIHFVPSILRAFLDDADDTDAADGALAGCPSLRRVFCSGEALPHDLQQRFFARHPAELVNLYGPTEAAVDVTHWRCRDDGRRTMPIGRPIANITAHVWDADRRPVPLGVPGELYLGGVGLALGYHGDPELTAKRFPVTEHGRVYRTGDLVRQLPDGELEFLGRLDDQVKIRGLRVELGEIETLARAHSSVRDCAVAVRGEALVGCVVPMVAGRTPDAEVLRTFLAGRLPGHMVPGVWLVLDEIPLSANGKVDRAALNRLAESAAAAASAGTGRDGTRRHRPPGTDDERTLVALWEEVLGTRPIGVDDTFAELGGHSLAALRLIAAIRRRFDRGVPLTALLNGGTVGRIAELLGPQTEETDDGARLVPLRERGDGAPVIMIHPVGGSVFCYQALAERIDPRHPVYGVTAAGLTTGTVGPGGVSGIAAEYLKLILDRLPRGPYHLVGWSFGGAVVQELARLLHDARAPVGVVCLLDAAYPGQLDVEEGDVGAHLRADLAGLERPEPEDFKLLLSVYGRHLTAHARHLPVVYPGDAVFVQGKENSAYDSAGRWQAVIGGEYAVHTTDLGHYELLRPPHVDGVARVINDGLGAHTGRAAAGEDGR